MLAFYVAILDTEEQKDKFTEIYTTYYGMMYQVARAITHDDKLAEDALHETCLELIEKIDSIRTDNAKQLAYYLRMVTRNRTIDFMRKWDRRSALSYDAVDVEPASLHEDAADVVLTKMRLETTLKSLDEMPPVYRTALILRVQGYSIKEIAHITNSSAAAVKTRIHRARQLLLQNSQNGPESELIIPHKRLYKPS